MNPDDHAPDPSGEPQPTAPAFVATTAPAVPPARRADVAAPSGGPGWMGLAMTAALALICGVGGAWAFTRFGPSNDKDRAKPQAKAGDDPSKGPGGGEAAPGSPKPPSPGEADDLKDQMRQLDARFASLQQKVDAMATPRDTSPLDLAALRVKLGELSSKVDEVGDVAGRDKRTDERFDRLEGELKGLRDQLSAPKERSVAVAPAPSNTPAGNPTDEAMTSAVELFKKGLYARADEDFGKLRASKPQDARVWYYSALAHGFATGRWDGETRAFVVQGADRERQGSPPAMQIDSAFAWLGPAQGKDWLTSYRAQLVKR